MVAVTFKVPTTTKFWSTYTRFIREDLNPPVHLANMLIAELKYYVPEMTGIEPENLKIETGDFADLYVSIDDLEFEYGYQALRFMENLMKAYDEADESAFYAYKEMLRR